MNNIAANAAIVMPILLLEKSMMSLTNTETLTPYAKKKTNPHIAIRTSYRRKTYVALILSAKCISKMNTIPEQEICHHTHN